MQILASDDITRRFLHGFWAVRQRMVRHVQPVMKERHELEIGDFFLLDYIDRSGLSPTEIAAALELPAPAVSRRLERLERQRLIRRRRDTRDARRRVLDLTATGDRRLAEAAVTLDHETRRLLSALPAEHLEEFLRCLDTLAKDQPA